MFPPLVFVVGTLLPLFVAVRRLIVGCVPSGCPCLVVRCLVVVCLQAFRRARGCRFVAGCSSCSSVSPFVRRRSFVACVCVASALVALFRVKKLLSSSPYSARRPSSSRLTWRLPSSSSSRSLHFRRSSCLRLRRVLLAGRSVHGCTAPIRTCAGCDSKHHRTQRFSGFGPARGLQPHTPRVQVPGLVLLG